MPSAGNGQPDFRDHVGDRDRINTPIWLALHGIIADRAGNVYVAKIRDHRVLKATPSVKLVLDLGRGYNLRLLTE